MVLTNRNLEACMPVGGKESGEPVLFRYGDPGGGLDPY